MGTLASWSMKAVSGNYGDRGFSSSGDVLGRLQIRFLRYPRQVNSIAFSHSIFLKHTMTSSFAAALSSSEPQVHLQEEETQAQGVLEQETLVHGVQEEETQVQGVQEEETRVQDQSVQVKVQLQKECSFGDRFYIVGDDSLFGFWDPASALPMNWSDGHVWTVELDIPIGKLIHFKFILKAASGSIFWQPDPDRIFQTWETKNKITVFEDWGNAELQKIVEEGPTFDQNEEPTIDSEMLVVVEETTQLTERQMANHEGESTTISTMNQEKNTPGEKPMAIIAENITVSEKKLQMDTNEKVLSANNLDSELEGDGCFSNVNQENNGGDKAMIRNEGNLVSCEGVSVLIPGSTPLTTADVEEESPVEFSDVSVGSETPGKSEEHSAQEVDLKEEPDIGAPHRKGTSEMIHSDWEEPHGNEQVENSQLENNGEPLESSVFESDVQWGRKIFQKFLTNLRFF